MKLEKILDQLNSFEKNSILKIIDTIISNSPKNAFQIEKVLSDKTKDLKAVDNINVAKVFELVEGEFCEYAQSFFKDPSSQFDILTDFMIKDGNCIMKLDWLSRLYEKQLSNIQSRSKNFINAIVSESDEIDLSRKRDYLIYKACLNTAWSNDLLNNQEEKITQDEYSILITLAKELELSQEEIKLINYSVIPLNRLDISEVINDLKNYGVLFYSKKNNTVFIPDEIVRVLRKIRGKEIADKFFRRILRLLREPQLNLICKKHNINWRMTSEQKIKAIIAEGISFRTVLTNDIFKDDVKISEKKKFINDFFDNDLKISMPLRGATIEEKLDSLKDYFEEIEKDERVGISIEGYEKLLRDLESFLPSLNDLVKEEFELQEERVLVCDQLLDFNIKPRDIIELIQDKDLVAFCNSMGIKTRGDLVVNTLDAYKDAENLYLENYENIGFRNLNSLKDNGIPIKEVDLGLKFEELTKTIFVKLGFNVDEELRKQVNTKNDRIDILLNLGNNEVIVVECKTNKESGYNKFSSVSRQLKAYLELAKSKNLNVVKSLLIAPEFSDDFINECGLEYELNLSLISAATLKNILDGFKDSRLKQFPYKLLMRDVLIQEERILKALDK